MMVRWVSESCATRGFLLNAGVGRPVGEGDAGDLLEIIDKGDVAPRLEQCGYGVLLALADLEGEQAIGFECLQGLGDEDRKSVV